MDILGVPSGAPQFWDNPRRLILSAEKKKIEMKRYEVLAVLHIQLCPILFHCFGISCVELVTKTNQVESFKTQTDKLKQLGRTLKSKNETLNAEINR